MLQKSNWEQYRAKLQACVGGLTPPPTDGGQRPKKRIQRERRMGMKIAEQDLLALGAGGAFPR